MQTDVIIIGAGASGLMCAMEAGRRGRSVLVLDHFPTIGSKIRISGGGHCNFTNRIVSRDHYLSDNPHFVTSALSRFTPQDFISMLENRGIAYEEREAGQLFCRGSADRIVDLLESACQEVSARVVLNCTISTIHKETRFGVSTNRGLFQSESLVIATGGLSHARLGATNFGYALAKRFGIRVTPLRPALTPLLFSKEEVQQFSVLSGIAIETTVSHGRVSFRGSTLFTHKGLSGPAILQISSYWDGRGAIEIDLLPDIDLLSLIMTARQRKVHLATFLDRYLPGRLAKVWCDLHLPSRPLNQIPARELEELAHGLHHWEVRPAAREGFHKAEVTCGGVDTRELSSKTMESKRVPRLYFVGEVVDVTGQLGGYNLHWAWASGHAAGQVV